MQRQRGRRPAYILLSLSPQMETSSRNSTPFLAVNSHFPCWSDVPAHPPALPDAAAGLERARRVKKGSKWGAKEHFPEHLRFRKVAAASGGVERVSPQQKWICCRPGLFPAGRSTHLTINLNQDGEERRPGGSEREARPKARGSLVQREVEGESYSHSAVLLRPPPPPRRRPRRRRPHLPPTLFSQLPRVTFRGLPEAGGGRLSQGAENPRLKSEGVSSGI